MPILFVPSANQISGVTLSSPTGYYGTTATFVVSTQGYNNGDTIYYSTTGSNIVQSTGTITVSNYLGDLGTANIPITTIRTTSTTAVITATFYNGSTPVTLSSGVNSASPFLATPDQFFTATVLLLSPAGPGPTALTDLSGTTSSIFVASSATVRSFIPFTTPGISSSMLFNGTNDYLQATLLTAPGTLFTIEGWVYLPAFSTGVPNIFSIVAAGSSNGFQIYVTSTTWGLRSNTVNIITYTTIAPQLNTWYHVAFVRTNSTSMTLYINGIGVQTAVTNYTFTDTQFNAGFTPIGQYLNAYISNIRYVPGVAVYTGNFTPPSGPLQLTQSAGTNISAITAGQTGLLLLQSPQSPTNTSFLDSASTNTVISAGGTPAQGTFSPFWPHATLFNGTSQYLTFYPHPIFALGTGNFTLECWIYLNTSSTVNEKRILANQGSGALNAYQFYLRTNNRLIWQFYTQNSPDNAALDITPFTWTHVAFSRSGTNIYTFINGVLKDTTVGNNSANGLGANLAIGASDAGNLFWPGYISNLRFIKGEALYTANFTPPLLTTPLAATTNTVLLACQGPTTSDYSTFTNTVTNVGSVVTRPISTTTFLNSLYSTSTNVGSMYFDGTTVISTTSTSGLHTLGSNDFTAECWFYTSTVSGNGQIIGFRTATLLFAPFILWSASGLITIYSSGTGASWNIANGATAGTVIFNQWNHLAVVRTVNTMTVYLNGTSTYSVSVSGVTFAQVGWPLQIGASGISGDPYTGFISNVRLVNGYAIYPLARRFAPSLSPVTASLTGTSLVVNGDNSAIYDATGLNNITTLNTTSLTTAVVKFGSNSIQLLGTSYLNVVSNTSTNFTIGTGDFTVEMWIYPTNVTGTFSLLTIGTEVTGRYTISIINGAVTTNLLSGANVTMGGSIGVNNWTHVAVARQGSTIRGFVNGVLLGTTDANSGVIGNGNIVKVGSNSIGASTFQGYISDVRFTKLARYTASFTSATTYLPPI